MRARPRSIGAQAPVKVWFQSFSFVLLLTLAAAILLAGRSDLAIFARLRVWLTDWVSPVSYALSRPVEAGRDFMDNASDYFSLKTEVERLRLENTQLRGWQTRAQQLEMQNRTLRSLLKVPGDIPARFVTARVVADASSEFVRGIVVLAGEKDGLEKGQAAMTEAGLAGRVLEVGNRASRVLLLTDINSRIPALIERTREPAVIAGNNTDFPEIRYLTRNADIKIGDRVITSGSGGAFPPGLPVGIVAKIGDSGILVAPFADLDRLEFIKLLDYGLSGLIAEDLKPNSSAGSEGHSHRTSQ